MKKVIKYNFIFIYIVILNLHASELNFRQRDSSQELSQDFVMNVSDSTANLIEPLSVENVALDEPVVYHQNLTRKSCSNIRRKCFCNPKFKKIFLGTSLSAGALLVLGGVISYLALGGDG